MQVDPAAFEICGHIVLKRSQDYEIVTQVCRLTCRSLLHPLVQRAARQQSAATVSMMAAWGRPYFSACMLHLHWLVHAHKPERSSRKML